MKNRNIPVTNLLIKPAGPDCNLNCSYCFYLHKSTYFGGRTHRMNDETLEMLIKKGIQSSDTDINFIWQGGEPALMGIDFYKKAIELQTKYGEGKTISNSFQTNGLLLNQEWAKFLKKHNFLVGLSLDGPEHIHNKYRKFPNETGSWQKVFDNAMLLLNTGVEVNAMVCVTDYSSMFANEMYRFFKQNGLNYMQFISIIERSKTDNTIPAKYTVSPEQYGNFLCQLFDCWINDFRDGVPTTFVNPIEAILFNFAGLSAPECTLNKNCGTYMVIEHNGDVYACDFFVESDWRLGTLFKDDLRMLLNSGIQDHFGKLKNRLKNPCIHCEWVRYCHGGCTRNRWGMPSSEGNYLCAGYKMFYEHAHLHLKKIAIQWINSQNQQTRTYDLGKHFK